MKKITIAGVGMGNPGTLTLDAVKAVKEADVLAGAKRIVEDTCRLYGKSGVNIVGHHQLGCFIEEFGGEKITVLMSGDTGFYSGAKKLCDVLEKLDNVEFQVLPGISSLQYFTAKLKTCWEDVKCVSLHGRDRDPAGPVQVNRRTFFLLGKNMTADRVCRRLVERNLGRVKVYIGEKLSYPEEKITEGRAEEMTEKTFDDLSVILVENPDAMENPRVNGIKDAEFIRGGVPMTKEEVRRITVSKMAPAKDAVIWDVGAGTGSVSAELAMAAAEGKVIAVESKPEGAELIRENAGKFGLGNIEIVEGRAPEALKNLPAPDCVFIGGTGGNLKAVMEEVFQANSRAHVVLNAVTLETICEAVNLFKDFGIENTDITQVSVVKTRKAGKYNMLDGNNPVFIISGDGPEIKNGI